MKLPNSCQHVQCQHSAELFSFKLCRNIDLFDLIAAWHYLYWLGDMASKVGTLTVMACCWITEVPKRKPDHFLYSCWLQLISVEPWSLVGIRSDEKVQWPNQKSFPSHENIASGNNTEMETDTIKALCQYTMTLHIAQAHHLDILKHSAIFIPVTYYCLYIGYLKNLNVILCI